MQDWSTFPVSWFSGSPREAKYTVYALSTFGVFLLLFFFFWLNVVQTEGIWHDSSALNRLALGKKNGKKKIPLNCGITVAQAPITSICQLLCRSEERAGETTELGRLRKDCSETQISEILQHQRT